MTKSEFARLIGVTPSRVSQLIDRGMPVEFDERIDQDAAISWYRANIAIPRQANIPQPPRPSIRLPALQFDELARQHVEGELGIQPQEV